MRAWGRINGVWLAVETAPDGDNSAVYLVNLVQVLLLNRNESPFFANYGIPGHLSVITQIFPDIYALETQAQFAAYFASLIITRVPGPGPDPVYRVSVTTKSGAVLSPMDVAQ